MDRLKNSVNPF